MYRPIHGSPTFPRRKFTASFTLTTPANFIIEWTMDWMWLCRRRHPYPGSDAAARLAPQRSTSVPSSPKYRPTMGATRGHGCPRYDVKTAGKRR